MTPQDRYVQACGSFRNAVHVAMSLSRAAWVICTEKADELRVRGRRRRVHVPALRKAFERVLEWKGRSRPSKEPLFEMILELAMAHGICEPADDGHHIVLEPSIINPLDPLRAALEGVRPDYELRYFAMQNIRHYYGFVQSSIAAQHLHALASAVNGLIERSSKQPYHVRTVVDVQDVLMPCLSDALHADRETYNISRLFLECCRILKYLWLSEQAGFAEIRTRHIDAEYLLSRLFGMPTGIPGLDDLFGGGGLMLVEAAPGGADKHLGGRAVLTVGPFGTGKSLLGLQVAVEVARKGGVAWVMPMEQSAEECLYALQTTRGLPEKTLLHVATTVSEALPVLEQPDPEKGALILLRTIKDSFDDFIKAFGEHVHLMRRYPLRLIVVDPVSAVSPGDGDRTDVSARRMAMLQMFETVKQQGTNIWLVAEEQLPGDGSSYEQNIADTVIQVSKEERHGYSQRYIEITKSRLQREQRGRHAFAIGPGRGITIFPSPAAVRARIKTRTMQPPGRRIKFGLASIDSVLGPNGINAGDVVVLQGPRGCSKTEVGLSFLLEPDWHSAKKGHLRPDTPPIRAFLISARANEGGLHDLLRRAEALRRRQNAHGPQTPPADVRIVMIEGGYVKPGYILQRIEEAFQDAQRARVPVGRVMVDSIPHWDSTCPYVREDHTFGDTLIELLRRHRVTTAVTCGRQARYAESVLHRSILDSADCLIQFESVEFRGVSRVMVRVAHSRDMAHRREFFELRSDGRTLALDTASTLLRIESNGRVAPVKVRLFLTADTRAQEHCNATMRSLVRNVLSRDADVQTEQPLQLRGTFQLAASSAIDELQIMQLEEFQLPAVRARHEGAWHFIPRKAISPVGTDDLLPRLRERVVRGSGCLAVPYYVNIGLFAARTDVSAKLLTSWDALSRECQRWEGACGREALFFDFTKRPEDYTSLFLEILLTRGEGAPKETNRRMPSCAFETWITSEDAMQAMLTMHRLCSRAHRHSLIDESPSGISTSLHARVWRHWYTTLNEMLAAMPTDERGKIGVHTLPGKVSISGDTFLGIPAYSAATDVGPNLIRLITSQEAEQDRMRLGVGLPTRQSSYASNGQPVQIAPYVSMDPAVLHAVVSQAMHRSAFGCYESVAALLHTHITSVLSLDLQDEQAVMHAIGKATDQLRFRLGFIERSDCHRCRVPHVVPTTALRADH